jgi:DNA-binding NarL/FixJ family response regulator
MRKRVKLLLVDDHQMVITGLRLMLEQQKLYDPIITEVDNGELALKEILTGKYDMVLLDLNLPIMDGISVLKKSLTQGSKTPIMVITMHNEEHLVKQAVEAGASGYLIKNCGIEELTKAINTILSGNVYFCNEASQSLLTKRIRKTNPTQKESIFLKRLTEREKQVLKFIAEEKTNAEVANILNVSVRTIEGHRAKIISKLEVKNTVGLIRFSLENGLLD